MLYFGSALHDMAFVAAAAVICLLSSWEMFHLMVRGARGLRRTISIVVLAGLGVWSTHFVAILGLRPDFLIAYSIAETMGSMVVAIVIIGGGFALAAAAKRLVPALLAGACGGAGISAMHHLGMYGLSGCIVRFDTFSLITSTLAAMTLSMLAIAVSRSSVRYKTLVASTLFVAGVVTLHFGSIIGTTLQVGAAASWVMSETALIGCQIVAILVLISPISTIFRRQIAYYREATLSGQVAMATDEGVVTMDATGRLTWANDAFLRMTGLDRNEIHNVNSVKIVERFASLDDADTYRHAIETGNRATIDVRVERRGPEPRWQRIRLIPKKTQGGALIGFVSAHQDISVEKIALERLRASQAEASRLAIAAEYAADSMLITDARGRTIWANTSFERTTGYTLDEILGRNPGEILRCDETNPATLRSIKKAIDAVRPIRTEFQIAKKGGDTYWNELELSPVRQEGKPLQFVGVSRDVSERIEREERLKEARRKAEAANEMKSEFLARMSHEIRTPMNGVTGLTEVLSTTDLSDEQTKYVDHIRECSAHLLQVVNDVFDFSSIAKGDVSLSKASFDVREVAEEALSVVRLAAKEQNLKLDLDLDTGLPPFLLGDKERLKQVLLKLLSNAVKFTEAGAVTLKVSPDAAGASEAVEGVRLKFSVSDTGVGIPPEMQRHVFEPFRQVEESATRSYEGTGLGLTIAKDIVTAMGGRLTVDSEVGKGSTFAFSLRFDSEGKQGSETKAA